MNTCFYGDCRDTMRRLISEGVKVQMLNADTIQLSAHPIQGITPFYKFVRETQGSYCNWFARSTMRELPVTKQFSFMFFTGCPQIAERKDIQCGGLLYSKEWKDSTQNNLCFGIGSLITIKWSTLNTIRFLFIVPTSKTFRYKLDRFFVNHANVNGGVITSSNLFLAFIRLAFLYSDTTFSINQSCNVSQICFSHKSSVTVVLVIISNKGGDVKVWLRQIGVIMGIVVKRYGNSYQKEPKYKCVLRLPHTGRWGLRDYGHPDQLGLERTPELYVQHMVEVFSLVRELLTDDGTCWINLGDSYAASSNTGGTNSIQGANKRMGAMTDKGHNIPEGLKQKDLCGIPWRVAFALQADGWYLRSDIIWSKPNPMPESVTDRPTKAHEYLFLLSKNQRYYFDQEAVREAHLWADRDKRADGKKHLSKGLSETGNYATNGVCYHPNGRNIRSVWTIPTQPTPEAHFATFPEALIVPCIKAGSREGDTVLDPFFGSGTTGRVCIKLGRKYIGCELQENYKPIIEKRTAQQGLDF